MKPHTGQEAILRSKARFKVVACGRRFGKTEAGKLALVAHFLMGGRCWWLAPTYQMASQVWRDLKAICAPIVPAQVSEAERRIDLPNGGMLAIRSTYYADHLRGAGLDLAVLDEAAYMDESVWPEVVRPMLVERGGAALFLSSPNGRNWFWELYQQGLDPANTGWRSFRFTSYDNPLIAPGELDDIQRMTPKRVWREEYLAEFVDDEGQVFRRIREAATAPLDAQPAAGRRYIAGLDWGRQNDFTAIVLIDADSREMVALDRFRQVNWALQRARLAALCERWQPVVIWAEANSIGGPNIEALQAEGLPVRPFQMTAQSKGPLIDALALAIEKEDIALLPDETLLNELAAYTLERLPGGGYRYGASAGFHDDTVIALALAWHGVQHSGVRLDFV
ncbi:MAG TPA: terminase family protein [Spirillospora sp.]|nr:terminase family protein [Spirillospora sp.]